LLGGTVHVATIAPLFATSLFTHYGKLLTEDMPDLTAFFKNTQKGVEKLVATFYEPRFQEFMLLAAIITMLSLSSMVIFKITEKLIDKKNGKSLNDLLGEPKTAKEIANLVTEFSPVAEKFQKQGISKQHLKRVHIN
jgi:hypothetical protein